MNSKLMPEERIANKVGSSGKAVLQIHAHMYNGIMALRRGGERERERAKLQDM